MKELGGSIEVDILHITKSHLDLYIPQLPMIGMALGRPRMLSLTVGESSPNFPGFSSYIEKYLKIRAMRIFSCFSNRSTSMVTQLYMSVHAVDN